MKKFWIMTAILLWATPAVAESECSTDADCAEDEYCVKAPCPACPPGEECPPCEPEGRCTPEYEDDDTYFVFSECAVDADCPAMFVCEEVESWNTTACACPDCACPPCEEGEECPPCECEPCECDDEPTSETEMRCVYHPAECSTDNDCESGFICHEIEECRGGGSTGCACACECAACPEGEQCEPCECPPCECDEDPVEYEEECEVVAAYCVPDQIECSDDSDCPDTWTCSELETGCACPPCTCATEVCVEGEECPEPEPCECPPCQCDTENYCLPAGWEDIVQEGVSYGAGEDIAVGEENGQTGAPRGETESETSSPMLPGWESSDGASGATNDDTENTAGGDGNDDGGCTMGGNSTATLPLLAILMLFVAVLRRRETA